MNQWLVEIEGNKTYSMPMDLHGHTSMRYLNIHQQISYTISIEYFLWIKAFDAVSNYS